MSEIKKGDWIYVHIIGHGEHVFQRAEVSDGWLRCNVNNAWSNKWCYHRLEPLKQGDKLEVGDRVVVIDRSLDNDPGLGTIHCVLEFSAEARRLPIIDAAPFGWIMEFKQLARLPDCAQDERCETSDEKETHRADDVSEYEPLETLDPCYYRESARTIRLSAGYRPIHPNCVCNMISVPICESCATLEKDVRINKNDQPIPYVLNEERCQPSPDDSIWSDTVKHDPIHCPHPEYDGSTWDYCGEGFKIYWENNVWIAHSIKPSEKWNPSFPVHSDPLDLVTEEDSFWRLVELAPRPSTPGKKLGRPRRHGGIKTPWDPWDI